jgi:hypothetical protein
MTQKELVGSAETEHNKRMPVQAVAKPAPRCERLKFTHSQRADVTNSSLIQVARGCMMDRVRAAPIVVGSQCQNTEKPAYPIVSRTVAKERTMPAIVLDHEQSHEKTGSGYPQQKR